MKRKFVRVILHSGSEQSPMGEEVIAIYCQCEQENPSAGDVNITDLENWVNNNTQCRKNQSSDPFIVSGNDGEMEVIALEEREIKSCHQANRIFPCLVNYCPGM